MKSSISLDRFAGRSPSAGRSLTLADHKNFVFTGRRLRQLKAGGLKW